MPVQEIVEEFSVEFARIDFGRAISPPVRRAFSVMKANVSQLAGIGEYERPFALNQDEVIVFIRSKLRRFDMRFAGHSEMNAKPVMPGKFKQHLFAASF